MGGSTTPETPAPAAPAGPGAAPPTLEELMGRFKGLPWFWQLLALAVIGPPIAGLMGPLQQELRNVGFQAIPDVPLSPADLATAIVRGFLADSQDTRDQAAQSGVNPDRFATLVQLAGQAIAPQQAAEALRRGIIPEDSGSADKPGFVQAIHQGDLRDMWTDVVRQLALALPSPTNALDALLEGQVPEALARQLYQAWGGALTQKLPDGTEVDVFQTMFNTQGSAPTPVEAATMANRGIIPWTGTGPDATTFEQAFLEGPWRNKWLGPYEKLAAYYPPPRTIVAMIREGALSDTYALQLLKEQGLSQQLAEAYFQSASSQKLAGTKAIAQSTIEQLYYDHLISSADATKMLEGLGYSAQDAGFILAIQDLKVQQSSLSSAVSKIRSLYIGFKVDRTAVVNALNALQMPPDRQAGLLNIWDLERAANVQQPTPAEITSAFHYQVIDQAEAMTRLQQRGYTPYDAWLLLSTREHTPLPGKPAEGPAQPTLSASGG